MRTHIASPLNAGLKIWVKLRVTKLCTSSMPTLKCFCPKHLFLNSPHRKFEFAFHAALPQTPK